MCVLLGASTDMGFSAYWPTLLFFAPSFAGLFSGAANSLAHISGFAAPHLVANVVDSASLILLNRCLCILLLFFFLCREANLSGIKFFALSIFLMHFHWSFLPVSAQQKYNPGIREVVRQNKLHCQLEEKATALELYLLDYYLLIAIMYLICSSFYSHVCKCSFK